MLVASVKTIKSECERLFTVAMKEELLIELSENAMEMKQELAKLVKVDNSTESYDPKLIEELKNNVTTLALELEKRLINKDSICNERYNKRIELRELKTKVVEFVKKSEHENNKADIINGRIALKYITSIEKKTWDLVFEILSVEEEQLEYIRRVLLCEIE